MLTSKGDGVNACNGFLTLIIATALLARPDLPATKFAEPLYRSAICISTTGSARGTYLQSR